MRSNDTLSNALKTNSTDFFTEQRSAKKVGSKMQYGSSVHHAKHQLRRVASEDYEVPKVHESRFEQMPGRLFEQLPSRVLDFPPYADSYMNSYSFEFRPETQNKVGVVDYNQRARYEVNAVDDNQRAKYKINEEEEDVNAEADEFIKHEHKKFQLCPKTMSFFR